MFMEDHKKIIGFCKQCFNKLYAPLNKCLSQSVIRSRGTRIVFTSTQLFRENPIFRVRLQVANVGGNLQPLSCQGLEF